NIRSNRRAVMVATNVVRMWDPEIGSRPLNLPMNLVAGQAGSSGTVITASGGLNPASTGTDVVVAAITIPAGAFAGPGDTVQVSAYGTVASNTNAKTIKIIANPASANVGSTVGAGGTTIASMTWATVGANQAWAITADVAKTGAAGTNTQIGVNTQALVSATNLALTTPQTITASESGTILIALTINAGTTVTDAAFWLLTAEPIA